MSENRYNEAEHGLFNHRFYQMSHEQRSEELRERNRRSSSTDAGRKTEEYETSKDRLKRA